MNTTRQIRRVRWTALALATWQLLGLPICGVHAVAQTQTDGSLSVADGIALGHSIVLPDGVDAHLGPRIPTLLVRTAYDRKILLGSAQDAARAGLAVVVQDCRGTGSSQGSFVPFVHEEQDGIATLAWIRAQPWCDGRIATTGMSYLGITQHFLLPGPHDPCAMVLQFTSGDVYHDLIHFGGGQSLAIALHWALMTSGQQGLPRFRAAPLCAADDASGKDVPYWNDWTEHESFDDYWRKLDVRQHQQSSTGAVLSIAGWYDLFLPGQVADYQRFAARPGPIEQRFARLIVGPWDHSGPGPSPQRPNLGPHAYGSTTAEEQEFLARFLQNEANGYEQRAGVRAFVLGANRWQDFDSWPPSAATPTRLYLRGLGRAHADPSDGLLLPTPPRRAEPADRYVYDPDDPTPSFANSLWAPLSTLADLREIGRRGDVLVYVSQPAIRERSFIGDLRAHLWVRADVEDTDFCLRVVDIAPDGHAEWRGEGMLRARYRQDFEQPRLLVPGELAEIDVHLGPMAFALHPGHRIGLHVASANFPRFARHFNSGNSPGREVEPRKATIELIHEPDYPSYLELFELPAPPDQALPHEAAPGKKEN